MTRYILAVLVVASILALVPVGPALAQAPLPAYRIDLIGQLGGASYAEATAGNYAYVGVGPRLVVLNISDPAQPSVVGQSPVLSDTSDIVRSVAVAGSYAYVAVGTSGLHVLNISDPAAPTWVSSWGHTDGPIVSAMDVAVRRGAADAYVYVAAGAAGFWILYVRDGQAPEEKGHIDVPSTGFVAQTVDVTGYGYGSGALVGFRNTSGGYGQLQVINIPTHPSVAASRSMNQGQPYDVALVSKATLQYTAYISAGDAGLCTAEITITDPAEPVVTIGTPAYYSTEGNARGLALSDDGRLYVANGVSGMRVIADRTSPATQTPVDVQGNAQAVAARGEYAYVASSSTGVTVVHAAVAAPHVEASVQWPSLVTGVAIQGSTAYLTDLYGRSKLWAVGVADPGNMSIQGSSDEVFGWAEDVALVQSHAYVASWNGGGLSVLDVGDPSHPQRSSYFSAPSNLKAIAMAWPYAHLLDVQDDDAGLYIVDVSQVQTPTLSGQLPLAEARYANDMAIAEGLAYVAEGNSGLRIVDISNPDSPSLRGSLASSYAAAVAAAGQHAYLLDSTSGLRVVDASNPGSPTVLSSLGSVWGSAIAVSGSRVFVAGGYGVYAVDVADPQHPQTLAHEYSRATSARGMAVAGTSIYVAAEEQGLMVFRLISQGGSLYLPLVLRG